MQIDTGCRGIATSTEPFGAGIFLSPAPESTPSKSDLPVASRLQRVVAAKHLFIFSAEEKINANR